MSFLRPSLWIDGWSFGRALLKNGDDPWTDPATLGHFSRDLKGLIRAQVLDVNLDSLIDAGDAEQSLTSDETAQKIKTGLASVSGLGVPVAVSLPGPSGLAGPDGDEDDIDDLGLALSDLARVLASAGAAALLLREPDDRAEDFLGPLKNVAEHNGLALLIVGGGAPDGFDVLDDAGTDLSGAQQGYVRLADDASPDDVQAALDQLGL